MALSPLTAGIIFCVLWFMAGFSLYIGFPWIVATSLPDHLKRSFARQYWWCAMKARGETLVTLFDREINIKSAKRVPEYQAWAVKIGGLRRIFQDTDNRMTTSYRERLGLADDDTMQIVDQRVAEIGERWGEIQDDDNYEHYAKGDDFWPSFAEAFFDIPSVVKGVDLSQAAKVMKGRGDAGDPEIAEGWVQNSQDLHTKDSILFDGWEATLAFLGSFLVVFVVLNVLGGGAGGIGGLL